jgi:hypothetical protein
MFVASTLESTSASAAKSANLNDFSVIDHPWFRRPIVANTGRSLGESCPAACLITGSATAADIDTLVRLVQDKVLEKYGILLHPEVKRLGF